jgi:hypothetical protein
MAAVSFSRLGIVSSVWLAAVAITAAPAPRFDGRGWTVGNHQQSGSQILSEYVLPGQTVEDWKELVTTTTYLDARHAVPLASFVDRIHRSMGQGCPSLVWTVIQQDDKRATFEWHDSGCGGFPPQAEMDRLAVGDQGVYRLAYAVKTKTALPAEKHKQWLAILAQVPLAEGKP